MSTTEAPSIRLELDGKFYPPSELAWIEWAPCGCLCGVMTVRDRFTAEDAFNDMHEGESQEMRDRTRALGYRTELVTFEHYRTLDMKSACPHTPQWGWPLAPTPDGMEWRVDHGMWSKKRDRNHLFPIDPDQKFHAEPLLSACGGQKDYGGNGGFIAYGRMSHLDCARCAKIAASHESVDARPGGVHTLPLDGVHTPGVD